MEDVLDLSLERKEKKLRINGRPHTLKEMMGAQRDKWMNEMGGRMKTDASGKTVGVKDFVGLHTSLICKCLYDDATGQLVPDAEVQGWPASVQAKLFEECQKLNALGDEKNLEEAKND